MKILFYGDSITDMGRDTKINFGTGYGVGYPNFIAGELLYENPEKYSVINRGISGNRIVDLYARIKADVWNHQPDVISVLIGVNDVWHEIDSNNGVELVRFEKIYRMMIEETKTRLPNVKFILCEPFVLKGEATVANFDRFSEVKEYAKVVEQIAKDYDCAFVPLQAKFDEKTAKYGVKPFLYDGVHPDTAGARLIANEWLKVFREKIDYKYD